MDAAQQLDPTLAVALAWQPVATRPALACVFELDRRLAAVVAQAREPALAQIRLAWWRDRLADAPASAGLGEPLLATLSEHWGEDAGRLRVLVDGWEHLLGEAPLPAEDMAAFAAGRAEALAALADLAAPVERDPAAYATGQAWAFADLAWRSSDERERRLARSLGLSNAAPPPRSRALRGIAVLGGLANRALRRGEPPMHGRAAALLAIRLGMFGR